MPRTRRKSANSLLLLAALGTPAAQACEPDHYRPFSPAAKLTLSTAGRVIAEKGVVDGFAYEIDVPSGRMEVAGHIVTCADDPMTDETWCRAQTADLVLLRVGKKPLWLIVGERHAPGSRVWIRIDRDPPVSTSAPGWTGRAAEQLLSKLDAGITVSTRWTRAGTDRATDNTGGLPGLGVAARYINDTAAGPPRCRN